MATEKLSFNPRKNGLLLFVVILVTVHNGASETRNEEITDIRNHEEVETRKTGVGETGISVTDNKENAETQGKSSGNRDIENTQTRSQGIPETGTENNDSLLSVCGNICTCSETTVRCSIPDTLTQVPLIQAPWRTDDITEL